MQSNTRHQITGILLELTAEGRPTGERCQVLISALYNEMREMAEGLMRRERASHTLQPTALVHEAYLKLVDQTRTEWKDRAHFLGVAAQVMRRILIDYARGRSSAKRGGDWRRVTLDEEVAPGTGVALDLLALDEALAALAAEDERAARVAELRLMGGLTSRETGEVLGVSTRTVEGDWAVARLWLARALRDEHGA